MSDDNERGDRGPTDTLPAAAKYKPWQVELSLVAEAPPAAANRYFYFEDIPTTIACSATSYARSSALNPTGPRGRMKVRGPADRGVFLIDLNPEPKEPGEALNAYVPDLVRRARSVLTGCATTVRRRSQAVCAFDAVSSCARSRSSTARGHPSRLKTAETSP